MKPARESAERRGSTLSATGRSPLDRVVVLLLAVYGGVVLISLLLAPHFFLPAEDVVILHQYSRNLAHHGAVTYYVGGPHAEGATDFGWMVLLAGAIRLGISADVFTATASFFALLLLAVVLLKLAELRLSATRVLAIAGAAGLMPQIFAAISGFPVMLDALLLALLVLAFVRQRIAAAALLALTFCLLRPDAVLFAVPLLVALIALGPRRGRRLAAIGLLFVLPGVLYFVWRAHYFGALLPLPFTVKSDVHRTAGFLVLHSLTQSSKYLFFDACLLLPLLYRKPFSASLRYLLMGILVVPTLFYWSMRLDQNVGDRFFFYLPLAAAVLIAARWKELEPSCRRLLFGVGAIAWIVFLMLAWKRELRTFRDYQFRDVKEIGEELGRLPSRGTLLTTEAGFLAYGSGWVAYDAWGLDTRRFAAHLVQPADVVALRPDLIVLHPAASESCLPQSNWQPGYTARTWTHMTRNLLLGAREAGGYELWLLSYGSPFYRRREHWSFGEGDRECFLVQEDSPRFKGIVASLRRHHAIGPPASMAIESSRMSR